MSGRALRLGLWFLLLAAALALTAYVSSCVAQLPDSLCKHESATPVWSPDRAYSASILTENCGEGALLTYSVRIESFRESASSVYPLAHDAYLSPAPNLNWSASRQLEVTLKTMHLTGSLQFLFSPDVNLMEHFVPDPDVTY